jgi:hypothetical protein
VIFIADSRRLVLGGPHASYVGGRIGVNAVVFQDM